MSSRYKNTERNIIVSIVTNGFEIFFSFIVRTAILYNLGSDYVGLSSLFTSILQVLNMAELGFSSAIIYNMYKPIAMGDDKTVCALLNLYRRVYTYVGLIILTVGLAITPFLSKLINGPRPDEINIYVLYILYLLDVVISYLLFAYKESLVIATQRLDVKKVIHTVTHFFKYLLQLIVLAAFKNYYCFVFAALIGTILNNIMIQWYTKIHYPQYVSRGSVSKECTDEVKKQVSGLMIGKMSAISRNSFDNIIISSLIGLSAAAAYNNYYFIFSGLYTVINYIPQAMQASIGDSIAVEPVSKNYSDLLKFQFSYSWMAGVCTICLLCLYQPFMRLWTQGSLMLDDIDMFLFAIYFFAANLDGVLNLYLVGNGLWWKMKFYNVGEAISNLLLNVLLGRFFGITGILISTIITMVFLHFVPAVITLYKNYFNEKPWSYLLMHFEWAVITSVCSMIMFRAIRIISFGGIVGFLIKLILCFICSNVFFLILFYHNKHFKYFYETIKRFLYIKI